jgi:integrase
MASIWRHPRSRYFSACFRDHTGRQRRITTKETDRRKALKIAEAFEKASREQRTLAHARRIIERLYEEISSNSVPNDTLRSFVGGWLNTKLPEVSERTFAFYSATSAKLIEFLGPRAEVPLHQITKADLIAFRNETASRTSAKNANHYLAVVRMLFLAARRDEVLSENPAEFVEAVRERGISNTRRAFSVDELRILLDHCDPEWRSLVLFGIYSGQRLSDLSSLTWNNVDLAKGELRLTTRKTGRRLTLPLAPPLQQHLENIVGDDPSAPIHPHAYSILRKQGRTASLSNRFAEILVQAGLRPLHKRTCKGRDATRQQSTLSFHSLRRTATTLLHEAGVPAAVAQALIGHDSEAIHELYVNVGKEALTKAAASLPVL